MSKKAHTRHHYIPQCYLRNFAHSEKGIYSYDKKTKTSYQTAISGVCTIDNFYSVSPENVDSEYDGEDPTLIIEKDVLADTIEACYNVTLQNIITRKNECIADEAHNIGLCYEDKYNIAKYVSIQFLRLKTVREEVLDMHKQFRDKAMPIFQELVFLEENEPGGKDLKIGFEYDEALLHAKSTFLDEELLDSFARDMANNYWSFYVSENNDFYTSDFPIVVESHVKGVRPMNMGLTQYGAEVSFPLSKDIVLIIWDREHFTDKQESDCKFVIVDDKEIRRQNLFRLFYAKRNVFSFHNNFFLAELDKMMNDGNHTFLGKNK